MKPAAQTKLLSTQERSEIMSRAMKTWWANRKAAEAKAAAKEKRLAKKLAKTVKDNLEACGGKFETKVKPFTRVGSSGVKVKLPRGTKVEGGKVKPPSRNIGRTKPQQYAAKTKKTWRKAG